MNENNELQVIVEESGLAGNKVEELLSHFGADFKEARELANASKGIIVTDENQKKEMFEARTARLKLREVRIRVEKTRQELKEDSLRVGKAIDGAANIIKALIVPVEEHLEKQEKFAEEAAKLRLKSRTTKRRLSLMEYVPDPDIYNLELMGDEAFNDLKEKLHAEKEAKKATEVQAEKDRIERERKVELYNTRKEQLIPYWHMLQGDQASTDFGEIPQESFDIILREVKAAHKQKTIDDEKMRVENEKLKKEADLRDKKTAEEREKREKAEHDLREQEEQRQKERQAELDAIEKKKNEELEEQRKRLLAPDRDKLIAFANALKDVEMPTVQSEEAKKTLLDVSGMMGRLDGFIRQRAKSL